MPNRATTTTTSPSTLQTKKLHDKEATRIIRRKINRDAINSLDLMDENELDMFNNLP